MGRDNSTQHHPNEHLGSSHGYKGPHRAAFMSLDWLRQFHSLTFSSSLCFLKNARKNLIAPACLYLQWASYISITRSFLEGRPETRAPKMLARRTETNGSDVHDCFPPPPHSSFPNNTHMSYTGPAVLFYEGEGKQTTTKHP